MDVVEAQTSGVVTSSPKYHRDELRCGIAHMSVGGFHRSHQALYVHEYLNRHPENWMIYGVGNLDADITLVNIMNAQENLYTLAERSGTRDEAKVIGSIKEFAHAPSNPTAVIDALASDNIKIISLTITEKGYCYDSAKNLDTQHPMIAADLGNDGSPVSAIGYIFEAAKKRMNSGGQAFTLMSCDNLPGNGHVASRIILQFADAKDPAVGEWIRKNVSFPNSMVDRITPAPSQVTVDFVKSEFGIEDDAALASESFLQWILEDNFINGRPALEEVGVQFVDNVEPYEKLKVRMLNGSHSALSYVSYLMGYRDVDIAMNDPLIRDFVKRYMDEDITPCIPTVPGVNVNEYKDILIERFSNPAVRDQIQRLAMDGSEKIPNAIVPPIEYHIEQGTSAKYIAFAVAAWYRYLRGVDEAGHPIEITDPMAAELTSRAAAAPSDPTQLLSIPEIFGESVVESADFVALVQQALDSIDSMGVKDALTKLLQQ